MGRCERHTHSFLTPFLPTHGRSAETHALKDEMATEVKDGDDDRPAAVLHLEKRIAPTSAKDELDAELKDLGGDCIKVMQLLNADSSLLDAHVLAVLHLGVSRGCIEIVEQVVRFYKGDGILGKRSKLEQQGVKSSREEKINASSDNTDAPTVALDELQTQIDDKNENNYRDPSHSQDDPIQGTAAGKGTSRHFLDFMDGLELRYGEIDDRPVLDLNGLRSAKYLYSGPARELDALEVAVVNGNLDVLGLLLTKTPTASRIGPKTRSVALRELHQNRLREITERVVDSIRGDLVSLEVCRSIFDALRNDPEFNFLFWDFGLGQERVSEYLFHLLFTQRIQVRGLGSSYDVPHRRLIKYLWREVWDYQGEPWEEPLWKSLLKLHDAQGRTPLHVAIDEGRLEELWHLLSLMPLADRAEVFAFAMEATDGLGRTPWHRALLRVNQTNSVHTLMRVHRDLVSKCRAGKIDAPGIYYPEKNECRYGRLWDHPMEDPVSRLKRRGLDVYWTTGYKLENGLSKTREFRRTTPLHSALLQGPMFDDGLWYGRETFSPRDTRFQCWVEGFGAYEIDALELATITGNVGEVKRLLTSAELGPFKTAYTREQNSEWGFDNRYGWLVGDWRYPVHLPYPTIHIAAYSGNYELLKAFIDSKLCDPYIEDEEGRTILHAVLDPLKITISSDLIDFANVKFIPPKYVGFPASEGSTVGRQGCINLLLQSGCDIFRVDKKGQAPYPKGSLSQDEKFLSWWYSTQLKEFTANQSAMSFATNAISVMATLVATASYVGPLQPPLGYSSGDGPNQIQVKYMWVRIFVVCDTLSFYLAIAAITFSLIPALPMPQQPMAAELEKTRGMIIWAVATLFPSIVCILLAFAASSIVVVSANGVSSIGGNLTIITGSMGGVICLLGFFLLFIRLLGILFPGVRQIRRLYDATSFLFEGKGKVYLTVTWVNRISSTLTHYWRHCFKH